MMKPTTSLVPKLLHFLEQELPAGVRVRNLAAVVDVAVTAFAIRRTSGNKVRASQIYGCQRVTFSRRLRRYGIHSTASEQLQPMQSGTLHPIDPTPPANFTKRS